MNDNAFTIPCGRLYDPEHDMRDNLFPCTMWATWEFVGRDGLKRYACGQHINTVLHDIVGDKRVDLTVKELRA